MDRWMGYTTVSWMAAQTEGIRLDRPETVPMSSVIFLFVFLSNTVLAVHSSHSCCGLLMATRLKISLAKQVGLEKE